MNNSNDQVQAKAEAVVALQLQVADADKKLKADQDKIDAEWATVQQLMIDNDVKSIKGEWGSLTIVEKIGWDTDPTVLPKKYLKKVVDVAKLTSDYKLTNKEVAGATKKDIKYLMKKIKSGE